jgi:glyoxalase/bleomycin resistance protein/dioxygenase superfamily protein
VRTNRSPDGRPQEPGRLESVGIEVDDLEGLVEQLRRKGTTFRNDIVSGVGAQQILVEDPSGNPIELFQPTATEARFR